MRPRAELDFIRDRVVAHVLANPPTGPLLTEMYPEPREPRSKSETCRNGHTAYVTRGGKRVCTECERIRGRAAYARHAGPRRDDWPTSRMDGSRVLMKRPRIDLRCSCSGEMVGTVSPASKIAPMREIFLSVHNAPGCAVTDRSSDPSAAASTGAGRP